MFHFIEYDAGVAMLAREAQRAGMSCTAFDKLYCDEHDKMTPEGFKLWTCAMMRVFPQGVTWFATQCSSFSWVSRSVSKRSKDRPWGRTALPFVKDGNGQAIRLALHMLLSYAFDLHFVLEQPSGSLLNFIPPVERGLLSCDADFVTTWLGAFGAPTPKPVKLMGNVPFIQDLRGSRPNLRLMSARTLGDPG